MDKLCGDCNIIILHLIRIFIPFYHFYVRKPSVLSQNQHQTGKFHQFKRFLALIF